MKKKNIAKPSQVPYATFQRVVRCIEKGNLARGVSTLACAEMAPMNNATFTALAAMHPNASRAMEVPVVPDATLIALASLKMTPGIVRKTLDGFKPGTAGGPDGLAPETIRDITSSPSRPKCRRRHRASVARALRF